MNESHESVKGRPGYAVDTKTIAAVGGVGAVLSAFHAALEGEGFVGILASAAVAGLACAIVGAVVSLHRKDADEGGSTIEVAQS